MEEGSPVFWGEAGDGVTGIEVAVDVTTRDGGGRIKCY